jgi:hypothetical protein
LNIPTPTAVQLKLIAAGALALLFSALLAFGLYWRGEYREAKVTIATLEAQSEILAEATRACSASVEQTRAAGASALAAGRNLLVEARKASAAGRRTIVQLEALLASKEPHGGCDDAWRKIESIEQKTGR